MTDTTPEPHKGRLRRIVKWMTLSMAAMVLLLASYIGTWFCCLWDLENNVFFGRVPYWPFKPLLWYAHETDLPGSDNLLILTLWVLFGGEGAWEDCETMMLEQKWGVQTGAEGSPIVHERGTPGLPTLPVPTGPAN